MLVYKSEKLPTTQLVAILKRILIPNYETIIVGDFNIDLKKGPLNKSLEELLHQQKLKSQLEIDENTTYVGTQIDWILSNLNETTITAGTYRTVFSYHCAIYIIVKDLQTLSTNNLFNDNDDLLLAHDEQIERRSIISRINDKLNTNLKKNKMKQKKNEKHENQSKQKQDYIDKIVVDTSDEIEDRGFDSMDI